MTWLSLDDAVTDAHQLLSLLTESHPDPYSSAGGPIPLHRRAAEIYRAIPEGGIDRRDFLRLLRPLCACLCDGHTFLLEPEAAADDSPQALPVEFDAVDGLLYVGAVYRQEDRGLLGAVLRAVETVPFAELLERMGRMRGADNEYNALIHLADALVDSRLLAELLERDQVPAAARLDLTTTEGERSIELPFEPDRNEPIEAPSAVTLPPLAPSDIGWGFLRPDRSVACLRVASLVRYREAFEIGHALGNTRFLETYLADVARDATGTASIEDVDAAIARVPSAAEQLAELFAAMRAAGTHTLLVDVRGNGGGNSFFTAILGYFLYGFDELLAVDWGYQVPRYSPLYLANYVSPTEQTKIAIYAGMMNGGYDFSEQIEWERRRRGCVDRDRAQARADIEAHIALAPSFARIVERGEDAPLPNLRVVVITSARTYSAGFDVAAMLARAGATVVGVPSSQAGNCFIDGLFFTLDRAQLSGIISYKWSRLFPDEPERGRLLRPELELTYGKLSSLDFDRNAAIVLALEQCV